MRRSLKKKMPGHRVLLLILFLICGSRVFAQDYIQVPAAIQVASQISDGKYTLQGIISSARDNGVRVVITAERDLMRWEYGIWPLRNIIKKRVETGSIFKYGIKRYLGQVKRIRDRNPDMIILAGVESAPFYFWEGSVFKKGFSLKSWHKHILTVGLADAGDYSRLPIIGNKKGLSFGVSLRDLFLFWPLLIVLSGLACLSKKAYDYKDAYGRKLGPVSSGWRKAGLALVAVGFIFLANNFPFRSYLFDQYNGDQGILPYQNFINYANRQDSLTYWLHPEASNRDKSGMVNIETGEYSADLLRTKDYTGFAVFHEGYRKVGRPGGLWDAALIQYCNGQRNKPVWAIGTLGIDANGDIGRQLKALRMVLLVPELNKREVYNALKTGRSYVVSGKSAQDLYLSNFSAQDTGAGTEKIIGEELPLRGNLLIRIKGAFLRGQTGAFKIKLIKNGKVFRTFEAVETFDLSAQDEDPAGFGYYRLEIESADSRLITNPIFVRKQ
jgi:hypothetical protein